jgi:hypothetical protein
MILFTQQTRKHGLIFWGVLFLTLVIDELFFVFESVSLKSYSGHEYPQVIHGYGTIVFSVIYLILIYVNLYALIVYVRAKEYVRWVANFILGLLFLVFATTQLNKANQYLMPMSEPSIFDDMPEMLNQEQYPKELEELKARK